MVEARIALVILVRCLVETRNRQLESGGTVALVEKQRISLGFLHHVVFCRRQNLQTMKLRFSWGN